MPQPIEFSTLSLKDALDLAILIEDEARERYEEFVDQLELHHTAEAAAFFRQMAANETKHGAELSERGKARFGDVRVREGNILLAGCRSDQTSADAHIGGDYHGAFTYYLVQTLTQANGNITYRDLASKTGSLLGSGNFLQVPQLEYAKGRDHKQAFAPF